MKTEGNLIHHRIMSNNEKVHRYWLVYSKSKDKLFCFTVDYFHQLCLLVPIQIWPLMVFQIGNM
jgi:hypothetical protein